MKNKIIAIAFTLATITPATSMATDYQDADQMYGWRSGFGQFYQTWADHISQLITELSGTFLTSESDPIFIAHDAHNVTAAKIANWDQAYAWGNHAAAGYHPLWDYDYADLINTPTIPTISDTAYGVSWNGDTGGASKNAIYDKIEALSLGAGATIDDTAGNGDTTVVWSADKSYDELALKYGSGSNATLGTISAGGGGFTVDADGDVVFKSATVNPTALGPQVTTFSEDSDNGSNYVGWGSPASNNNDLILLLPSSDPTAGQVLAFGVPSSVTFSDGVARDASVGYWETPPTASAVTYENLNFNGDVGTGASQVAAGDHTHSGYTGEIASGTATLGTSAIADGACATVVTVTATGTATTDVISWGFNSDPTSTTGYNPSGDLLYIVAYPTANNANFKVCNKSGSSITPGAVTLNWRVDR